MKQSIHLKFKQKRNGAPTHLQISIPMQKPLTHIPMSNTPAVPTELLDDNFDYITNGNLKVSVIRLKDKEDPEKIYLLIQKEKLPEF